MKRKHLKISSKLIIGASLIGLTIPMVLQKTEVNNLDKIVNSSIEDFQSSISSPLSYTIKQEFLTNDFKIGRGYDPANPPKDGSSHVQSPNTPNSNLIKNSSTSNNQQSNPNDQSNQEQPNDAIDYYGSCVRELSQPIQNINDQNKYEETKESNKKWEIFKKTFTRNNHKTKILKMKYEFLDKPSAGKANNNDNNQDADVKKLKYKVYIKDKPNEFKIFEPNQSFEVSQSFFPEHVDKDLYTEPFVDYDTINVECENGPGSYKITILDIETLDENFEGKFYLLNNTLYTPPPANNESGSPKQQENKAQTYTNLQSTLKFAKKIVEEDKNEFGGFKKTDSYFVDEKGNPTGTLELDLNTWKPYGMDDNLFLQSIKFKIDGFTNINYNNVKTSPFMDYNITKKNYSKYKYPQTGSKQWFEANFDNLDTENTVAPGSGYWDKIIPTDKLVFDVWNGWNLPFQNKSKGYCYIVLALKHEKTTDEQLEKGYPLINRLLITPEVHYSWSRKTPNELHETKIPSQWITFTLNSPLFSYNESSRISNDSYISDNKRFDFSQYDNTNENGNKIPKSYLEIRSDGTNGKPNSVELKPTSASGKKIPFLNIDTSGFYFSNDENNEVKNKEFLVSVEGVEIREGSIFAKTAETDLGNSNGVVDVQKHTIIKPPSNNSVQSKKLNLSFRIDDSFFDNNKKGQVVFELFNSEKVIDGYVKEKPPEIGPAIFNNNLLTIDSCIPKIESVPEKVNDSNSNTSGPKPSYANANLTMFIEPVYEDVEKIAKRIPFKYQITSMKFEVKRGNAYKEYFTYVEKGKKIEEIISKYVNVFLDPMLQIDSSNEVIVKTKPLDFSFTKINSELINSRKELINVIPNPNFDNKEPINVSNNEVNVSNYSSNVFDNSHFVVYDKQTNSYVKGKTNYEVVREKVEERFKSKLYDPNGDSKDQNLDAKYAMMSFDDFNSPFIQTTYTSGGDEYRKKGVMELKYTPKINNKYTKYLTISARAFYNTMSKQKELVQVSINEEELNNFVKTYNFETIGALVNGLNWIAINDRIMFERIVNITCLDKNISKVDVINFNLTSDETGQQKPGFNAKGNIIGFHFDLNTDYQMIVDNELKQKGIYITCINGVEIPTFNKNQVDLVINEKKVRDLAANYDNYKHLRDAHINIENNVDLGLVSTVPFDGIIKSVEFLEVDPNEFPNKISIRVTLIDKDGYAFPDNSRTKIVSIGNIRWKNEPDFVSKPIELEINYNAFSEGRPWIEYESANDFLKKINGPISGPTLEKEWSGIFTFPDYDENSSINNIHSIAFEGVGSPNKIKIKIQAKNGYYFSFLGSSKKDDMMEVVISNIKWNDGRPDANLSRLDFELDMPHLYQLLVKYYKKNPEKKSLEDFVNEYREFFLFYDSNNVSIIKVKPEDKRQVALNPAVVRVIKVKDEHNKDQEGILIKINVNEGYYWNKNNNVAIDRYISTYEKFISIDEIKEYHEDFTKPDPKNGISEININTKKIATETLLYKNVKQFLASFKNDFDISEYLIFANYDDIKKVKTFEIKEIDSHSIEISVIAFESCFFQGQDPSNKTKVFKIQNLRFKGEEQKLVAISVGIDRQKIVDKAREFKSRDEMVEYYKGKTSIDDYKEFLLISEKQIIGIESIEIINGSSLNSIQFVIKLKNGYYFKGKNPILAEAKIQISNMLFKDDPLAEDIYVASTVSIKGNEFLEKAKEFEGFESFKKWLFEHDKDKKQLNFKSLLNISFNKENPNNENAIFRFSIFQKSASKFVVSIVLNDGYYFDGEHFTVNEKSFVVGNVFFKDKEVPELNDIDALFNTEFFYKLTRDLKNVDWDGFLDLISPNIMNFNDAYNAILWTNAKEQKIFEMINVSLDGNNLNVMLELVDGYYFDRDDKSNVAINISYSPEDLKRLFDKGDGKVNGAIFNRNLIIGLSLSIPFAIILVVIAIWFIKVKLKNRDGDLKGE